jgi:hypothetical protein
VVSLYVCLTSGEWRNLCSTGSIRLHASRAVGNPEHAPPGARHELFSLAPDQFALGESSDLLVAEVSQIRAKEEGVEEGARHHGMGWLLLEDVIAFFPARADDAWVFEADAETARVSLSAPRFEGLWQSWAKAERERQAYANGMALCRLLRLLDDGATGPEGMEWSDLAALAIDPKGSDSRFSGLTVSLLLNRDALFDRVRADTNVSAVFVACPVEWADMHSKANALEREPVLMGLAHLLHERYRDVPFNTLTVADPELAGFLKELSSKVPVAFNDEWRPATLTLYTRYLHRIRFGKPSPDEVVGAVKAAEALDGRRPARLLAFLLGVALESNRIHALARQLQPEQFGAAVQAPCAESARAPGDPMPPEATA